MNYEQLLTAADQEGFLLKNNLLLNMWPDPRQSHSNPKGYRSTSRKICVLAEEIGHYRTSSGNILDQNKVESRKQEYRARLYGYNLKIGLTGLISAYEAGCGNLYEMAEYLNATEEYLKEAIQCYHSKYGVYAVVDNYVIYFEPFAVIHMISSAD